MTGIWDAVMRWAGLHPAASWFIHGAVCFSIAGALAWFGEWTIGRWYDHAAIVFLGTGAILMMAYYTRKEVQDWAKHGKSGELEESPGGVTKRNDGWGDLVGPVYFLVGVLSAWYWA